MAGVDGSPASALGVGFLGAHRAEDGRDPCCSAALQLSSLYLLSLYLEKKKTFSPLNLKRSNKGLFVTSNLFCSHFYKYEP